MPQKAWSDKRERQYEHIKDSYEDRGVSADEAEERAARTVNKERAEHGETKAQPRSARRDRDRLRALERGAQAARPRGERAGGRGGGLLVRADLRPLPSLDRSPGAEPVRVERARRRSPGRPTKLERRHRRDLPDDPASTRRSSPRLPRPRPPLMPGRFFLGLGTGENLNEHILGTAWPEWDVRAEMLEEAVEVIREAVERRGHQPPRPLLHRPERAHLLAARRSCRRSTWPPAGANGRASGGPHRRRAHRDRPGRASSSRASTTPAATGPRYGQVTVCWADTRAAGAADGARVVADRRDPRRGDPGAPQPRPVRAAGRIDHRGTGRRGHHVRSRSGTAPGQDPRVHRCRLRPRLPPPGRSRPGRLPALRRTRIVAGAQAGPRECPLKLRRVR